MRRGKCFDLGHFSAEGDRMVYHSVVDPRDRVRASGLVLSDLEGYFQAGCGVQRRKRLDGVNDAYNSKLRCHDGQA